MTVALPDEQLIEFISQNTNRPAYLLEVAPDAQTPFYLVSSMPGADWGGSLGVPNSMADLVFQVDIVALTPVGLNLAETNLIRALNENWQALRPWCMGPPAVRRNGSVREDDRTYKATLIVTLKVGE